MNEQETHTNIYVMQGSLAKLIKNSEHRNVKFVLRAKNSIEHPLFLYKLKKMAKMPIR